jgi:hypothetical protein
MVDDGADVEQAVLDDERAVVAGYLVAMPTAATPRAASSSRA